MQLQFVSCGVAAMQKNVILALQLPCAQQYKCKFLTPNMRRKLNAIAVIKSAFPPEFTILLVP